MGLGLPWLGLPWLGSPPGKVRIIFDSLFAPKKTFCLSTGQLFFKNCRNNLISGKMKRNINYGLQSAIPINDFYQNIGIFHYDIRSLHNKSHRLPALQLRLAGLFYPTRFSPKAALTAKLSSPAIQRQKTILSPWPILIELSGGSFNKKQEEECLNREGDGICQADFPVHPDAGIRRIR